MVYTSSAAAVGPADSRTADETQLFTEAARHPHVDSVHEPSEAMRVPRTGLPVVCVNPHLFGRATYL